MRTYLLFFLVSIILMLGLGCENNIPVHTVAASVGSQQESNTISKEFMEYWYKGTAEISSYSLKQERYGEIREGDAVLIFVTEPFSMKKQVKLDNPQQVGNDKVSVLKLNQVRKFNTGIYDYSIMSSSFTPVQLNRYPYTIKVTSSSQEWCGQTFNQLNLMGNEYRHREYSYFELEGDKDNNMKASLLEEDLMSRLRITGSLPLGSILLIPSIVHSRLAHTILKPEKASVSMVDEGEISTYTIHYENMDRQLEVQVEKTFPYKILGWTEIINERRTIASLKKTMKTAYWSKNRNIDEVLRQELGLTK